jgi:hypothetical protein
MNDLKAYFDKLLSLDSYRGWHIVQADRITHEALGKALQGIKDLSEGDLFQATDANLSKLNGLMGRGDSPLPVRKQVLVNLHALDFIARDGTGQDQVVSLRPRADEYLAYENKEFYMDSLLAEFEIHVPTTLKPFPILLKLMSTRDDLHQLSVKEFQYFASQILDEEEFEPALQRILAYRSLGAGQQHELDEYIQSGCREITDDAIARHQPKSYQRDYHNWANNAKHSLEFFSLGSQIKLVNNQAYLLLGSDELKRQILDNLKLIQDKVNVRKQTVHFRDKKIMDDLKKLYSYYCQFCGYNSARIPTKSGFYVEAAHIIPVSEQAMREEDLNDPTNIVIACPNHHKMIDISYPEFRKAIVTFPDGRKGLETVDGSTQLFLVLNEHL